MASRDDSNVVDLRSRAGYRPDMAALARAQVASARERLGLSTEEFASVLKPLLGWGPSPGVISNWETDATPPGDVLIAASIVTQAAPLSADEVDKDDLMHQLLGNRYADVEAVFLSRSEFTSAMPPQRLFAGATKIDAAGLSLNLLCQQYADQDLRALIEGGTNVRCLFLAPYGTSIAEREREEGYPSGHLSALTEMNRQILLQRVRERLTEEARLRLQVATYDETIRFNVLLVDDELGVVQPYLSTARGVESPTFLLRRRRQRPGLYAVFEQLFLWLIEQSTPA
jgi:Domain of unknown function (DUF5919)